MSSLSSLTPSTAEGYSARVSEAENSPRKVQVTASGLDLGGETLPLVSGEIHYFQHEPDEWPRLLDEAADLGLSCISTYIPWGRHEPEPGRYDFGEHDPKLDLDRFIELAADQGIRLIVRPGPHINAELNWLGYPRHVLEDEEIWARTPGGNPVWLPINPRPIPVPSYGSTRFLETVDRWLEEVGRRMAPRQWPEGPIVAVQIDNEAPLLFRNGPFDQDYHPEVLTIFQEFTAQRGRPTSTPPVALEAERPENLLPILDWIACRNHVFALALSRMRSILEAAGLDRVVFTHNIAQTGAIPDTSPSSFDSIDLVGFDFYHLRSQIRLIRDRCLYAVGTCELPFAAELGVGGPWNLPVRSGEDSLTQARAIVALGFRGFNLFMAADRDRYYGSPLPARPSRRRRALALGLSKLIEAFKHVEIHTLRLRASVAIVVPRIYPTLTHATWTLGPFGPPVLQAMGMTPSQGASEERFGFSKPIQIAWFEDLCRLTSALSASGVGWVIVDGEGAEARIDALSPKVVVALTYDVVERDLWSMLLSQGEEGRDVVVGPDLPTLDEDMKPLVGTLTEEGACEARLGRVDFNDASSCFDFAASLASRPSTAPFVVAEAEGIEVTALESDGVVSVVGIIELEGRRRRRVPLRFRDDVKLRDLLDHTPIQDGFVALEPHDARLLEIVQSEPEAS